MNEAELRQVLLLQAVEAHAGADSAAPWRADDGEWASAEARRQLGEASAGSDERGQHAFVLARARLGLQRLTARAPAVAALAAGKASRWPLVLPLAALLLGLVGDTLATGGRINLLAMPLLGLLGWNLLVYLGLAVAAVAGGRAGADPEPGAPGAPGDAHRHAALWQPVRALGWWLWRRPWPWQAGHPGPAGHRDHHAHHADEPAWLGPVRQRLRLALWSASTPLAQQRLTGLLHVCAAALALGALASMYGRGLVLDYRAGWDSTFLDAAQVHRLLAVVLAPGNAWPGLAMPDVASLAQWRWADGSAGTPAGPWIHRLAITVAALVLLPRGLLAWAAYRRAGRLARQLAPPLGQPYFQRLLGQVARPRFAGEVWVLPYSYRLPEASRAGLAPALDHWLGAGHSLRLAPSLPMGIEDELEQQLPARVPGWPPAAGAALAVDQRPGGSAGNAAGAVAARVAAAPPTVVALMSLTATPERETHGAFLQRLQPLLPGGTGLHLLLDSSVFVQRLADQPDASTRLAQRVAAWQRLLADLGLAPAHVADLSPAARTRTAAETRGAA